MLSAIRRVALGLAGLLALAAAVPPAAAQSADLLHRIITTADADYTGNDYSIVRDVTEPDCEAACLGDNACRAFTYNSAARWCFLKSDFGALSVAPGATAGRVVAAAIPAESTETTRVSELMAFLSGDYIDAARRLDGSLASTFPAGTRTYGSLLGAAATAQNAGNDVLASGLYGAALAIADDDPKVWLAFARATLDGATGDSSGARDMQSRATAAAVAAYMRSTDTSRRAEALIVLGQSLEARALWRPAIKAYRASLALAPDATIAANLDNLVAQHGFRIADTMVDADAANPRICVVFSDPLPVSQPGLTDFVTVSAGEAPNTVDTSGLAIEPEASQICIDGVQHGVRYAIRVRAGLPSEDGETLPATADLSVFVRDRSPWVGFAGGSYVLPSVAQPTIPVESVNADTIEAEIYQIGDRGLVYALQQGIFLSQLEPYRAQDIAEQSGQLIWSGAISVAPGDLNALVTTAIPVTEALGNREPGVYVITARVKGATATEDDYWTPDATQWFVISDLGLTAMSGDDGINVFVRSLASAEPEAGIHLRLIARNNDVLGEADTDADGHAIFPPGLARGTGGDTAQVVVAQTADGDYAFLDLTRPSFDLTDRGVDGRAAPGAIDAYLTTERGVYRPGETVHMTALLRDARANAVTGLPLTVVVERPDGVEHSRTTLADGGLGGYVDDIAMRADAMRGSWRISLYTDPDAAPVAEKSFLVEDFEPDRLAFDLTSDATAFDPLGTVPVNIAARYLYGATAPGLTVEGDIAVSPVDTLAAYPGFFFGRQDDSFERIVEPLDASAVTDENGNASIDVALPDVPQTTRLLQAQAVLRLTDTNGRAVERTLTLPVLSTGPHLGIRPQFDDYGVAEGSNAGFDVIAVAADGSRTAITSVAWSLSRIETNYQWYSAGGVWHWEAVNSTRRIANGTVDIAADQPAQISSPVDWGRYRLDVTSSGPDATSTTYEFDAGWYVANVGTDTPDVLAVALDKPSYQIGETAHLRLDPRFAGLALITVVDDRLISMQTVTVPADGTTVDLPVTADWGPGAYVTATLYRPMDVAAGRMPARALGLTWAAVDPGARDLDVQLDLPVQSAPRAPLAIPVTIANLAPGTEAYVVVTAVDLGILNLTNYQPPAPDLWYFGQRRLGVEIRDLYGNLIDTTQGQLGTIRSGGNSGAVRLGSPPPTQKLIAFSSGIVRVDASGHATVSFDMPDFNGTVRVMAEAWSAEGVGHAVKDVFVRDPVVVQATTPRFLDLGDSSRLLLEINNVSGPAGDYRLLLDADAPVGVAEADRDRTLHLDAGARQTIAVPITGAAVGDAEFRVTLLLPDGSALPKTFELGVRAPGAQRTQRSFETIAGNGGTLTVDASRLAGFVPGTAVVSVAAGGAARLDLPGVLARLGRYPYGCSEQLASIAMPLLYLDPVASTLGLGTDAQLADRIQAAIDGVLANETAGGAFGLWGPYDEGDLWLDAYVTDFLTRARAKGFAVPDVSMTLALDNLANALAYASDFTNAGEDIAYAAYVLAANGQASLGDLRYYAEVKLDDFATPLAKAQIGAAMALYGDRARAERAFAAAMAQLATATDPLHGWRSDYGSVLRDEAAVLTLATEAGITGVDIDALARKVADDRARKDWTSTQEDGWTVMAAAALIDRAAVAGLAVDGNPLSGPVYKTWLDTDIAASPVTVTNTGSDAVDAVVSVTGTPVKLPVESGNGYTITRTYYLPDGTLADVSTVAQNDRYVVALTVTATEGRNARLMVVDPLPAGFEIENPDLSLSGDVSNYPWLSAEGYVDHTEARTTEFVAAVNRYSSAPLQFTVAYTVRAVSPGTFVHAGATVEDMYRPEFRASTGSDTVEVVGPTQ